MKTLNPILALVGAAAANGNAYFAQELLSVSRGRRDALAVKRQSKRNVGLTLLSVTIVLNRKIQFAAFPSVC